MKAITKLYLKTFLSTGIPYAILMAIWDLAEGKGFNFQKFLFFSISFGALMSLILVSIHLYFIKKKGIKEISEENLSTTQKRDVTSTLSPQELLERLKNKTKFRKIKPEIDGNEIYFKTGVTWKTWGEKIRLRYSKIAENKYKYQVVSQPKIKTVIFDYGNSIENVNLIEKILKEGRI